MMFGEGLCFDLPGNRRDVAYEGDCDEGCLFLADQLGFGDELRQLVKQKHEEIKGKRKEVSDDQASTKEISDEKPDEEKEKLLKEEDEKPKVESSI